MYLFVLKRLGIVYIINIYMWKMIIIYNFNENLNNGLMVLKFFCVNK